MATKATTRRKASTKATTAASAKKPATGKKPASASASKAKASPTQVKRPAARKPVASKTKTAKSSTSAKPAPKAAPTQTPNALRPTTYTEVNRIHRASFGNANGSVVVTASHEGEGTSLIAHLLAQRSAETKRKTLLIDLNLRDTALTSRLETTRKPWRLAERKTDDAPLELCKPLPGLPNCDFLPAPDDETTVRHLKDPANAGAFMSALEKAYDHIVVDTTPVGVMNRYNADAVVLAAAARRCVLVMMAGATRRARLSAAVQQLRESGTNIAGIIVNDLHNPSLKSQVLHLVDGIAVVSPGLASWLRHKVLHSDLEH